MHPSYFTDHVPFMHACAHVCMYACIASCHRSFILPTGGGSLWQCSLQGRGVTEISTKVVKKNAIEWVLVWQYMDGNLNIQWALWIIWNLACGKAWSQCNHAGGIVGGSADDTRDNKPNTEQRGNVSAPGARRASFVTRALPVDCCR